MNRNDFEFAGTDDLTESEFYRLLASDRRRTAIDVLVDRTAPVGLDELAADVAGREDVVDGPAEETVERVATSLHHYHLPMLDEFGVLEYDPAATTIRSCPRRSASR